MVTSSMGWLQHRLVFHIKNKIKPSVFVCVSVLVLVLCKDLPAPSSLAEALQQRMDIYKSAAEGAKSKGDDRKARMHQRIVKVELELLFRGRFLRYLRYQNSLNQWGVSCWWWWGFHCNTWADPVCSHRAECGVVSSPLCFLSGDLKLQNNSEL